ncbi:MAG: Na/Pi cotransporter family protein, partial [Clostridia bacterium]|nr:Na/Pi cotransporter family protein [Clostridia bacterium]
LSKLEGFKTAFQECGKNPLLGLGVGMVVTAIIQSSSASVGIVLCLSFYGIVTLYSAVYFIMGQNI